MKKSVLFLYSLLLISFLGCKRNSDLTKPESRAEFPVATGSYSILNNPGSNFKIPIGFTDIQNIDRTINFSVTSPTGAVSGQQYTVAQNGSVTIPSGKALDSIQVNGLFAGYASRDKKDSLYFTITGGDGTPFTGFTTYKLVMQKVCPLVIGDYSGDFVVVQDAWEDYSAGDVITLTNIDATHFSFKNKHALNPVPVVVTVNTSTNAVKIDKQIVGTLWDYDDPAYIDPTMAATGTIVACDKVINLSVSYGSKAGNWSGTYALVLKKK
ncbi:hypothetical protein [Niabella drilacis]|uniref:Calx-beta domain-containing protein n=1 Tax=Niabella drilacis (strain DSM 25811 / CCM 8410 / CCUG 62505 / LMG 26954 / E90) TaxID=1285928 RepID=A0A1G6KYB0_NIADE|nr:hypothetical protein [Niabella drilacis]SDC35781.1 hypothetical protein SAMN04487894_102141 [Niabella drilacis]